MKISHKLALTLLTGLYSLPMAYAAAPAVNQPASQTACTPYSDPNSTPTNAVYQNQDTTIRIGGRIKADFYNDFGGKQPGPTFGLDSSVMPLKGWDYDALRQNNFNASLTASRISLDAQHRSANYNSYGYFELDFVGATHASTTPLNITGALSSGTRTTNNYTPRIRHAYGEVSDNNKENSWLIGQTWTNFSTPEVNAWSTNNLWPSFRTAQIRYTRKIVPNFTVAMALEKPNTQTYYFTSPTLGSTQNVGNNIAASYVDNDTSGAFNKSSLPDLTLQGKYQRGLAQFAIRAVIRRLEIKAIGSGNNVGLGLGQSSNANSFFSRKTGYGLGASAMFKLAMPVTLMFQVQGGKGIGRYIDDLSVGNAFDSYFQYQVLATTPIISRFEALPAINFMAGLSIKWWDRLESSLGGSYTKITLPQGIALSNMGTANTPASAVGNGISLPLPNTVLQRYHANLVYTILPKTFGIVELEQHYREAGFPKSYSGKDTRLVFSFIRQF